MASQPAVTLSNPRVELIARLLRGENRANMTPEEALAMGDTLINRTSLRGYPDTIEEVAQQNRNGRYQYSPIQTQKTVSSIPFPMLCFTVPMVLNQPF